VSGKEIARVYYKSCLAKPFRETIQSRTLLKRERASSIHMEKRLTESCLARLLVAAVSLIRAKTTKAKEIQNAYITRQINHSNLEKTLSRILERSVPHQSVHAKSCLARLSILLAKPS
jgi:hypothetical protein